MADALRELASAPTELLVRGTVVDEQYELERTIGAGAMGVVYLAKDLRLQRMVAVKVARGRSAQLLAHSSREAVLLARLSHPNVIVVHQVGALDGRPYVAMEYVAGATARAWCPDRRTSEIVELYAAVGDGLAAAHAAGLVHRDFKPDNVLVGEDGRGRVADFGLAREVGDEAERAGTPRYMPPEQLDHGDVDARADQYAFCASVREALEGKRVPRHIEAALSRGMRADREERWPSMAPLLAELRRRPTRTPLLIGAGVLGLAGVAAFAMLQHDRVEDPCVIGSRQISTIWPRLADSVKRALHGTPWVEKAVTQLAAELDGWSDRWTGNYHEACAAAWTPALHERAFECFARAKHELSASLDGVVLPGADHTKLRDLIDGLSRPESCADPTYLAQQVPPPADPKLRAQVDARLVLLDQVQVLHVTGLNKDAAAKLAALEAMPQLDWPPLNVRVAWMRALTDRDHEDDDKAMREIGGVYFAARAAGERGIAAAAAAEATVTLIDMSKDADASHWGRLAEVEANALADPILQAKTLRSLSVVATQRGDAAHGLELANRAIAQEPSRSGSTTISSSLLARSEAFAALGKYDRALIDVDAALAATAVWGTDSPQISLIHSERSLRLTALGRNDEAVAAARTALAIAEKWGEDSAYVGHAVGQLGIALAHADKLDEALVMNDRSMALDRLHDGDHSYNVASDLNNRCDLLTTMRRYADATQDCLTASAMFEEIGGPQAPDVAIAQFNLAMALMPQQRYEEARVAAAKGLGVAGKEGATAGVLMIVYGETSWRTRHLAEALPVLETAVKIFTESSANPAWLPWARLELAHVQHLLGKQAEALPLAVAARDQFRTTKDLHLPEAEQLIAALGAK